MNFEPCNPPLMDPLYLFGFTLQTDLDKPITLRQQDLKIRLFPEKISPIRPVPIRLHSSTNPNPSPQPTSPTLNSCSTYTSHNLTNVTTSSPLRCFRPVSNNVTTSQTPVMPTFSRFLESQRRNQQLLDSEGYIYTRLKGNDRALSSAWRCCKYGPPMKCPCQCYLSLSDNSLCMGVKTHNHKAAFSAPERREFSTSLKRKAAEQPLSATQNIVSESLADTSTGVTISEDFTLLPTCTSTRRDELKSQGSKLSPSRPEISSQFNVITDISRETSVPSYTSSAYSRMISPFQSSITSAYLRKISPVQYLEKSPRSAPYSPKSPPDSTLVANISDKRRNKKQQISWFQSNILKEWFNKNTYLTSETRTEVSKDTGLPEKTVVYWFKNRRSRVKRETSVKS